VLDPEAEGNFTRNHDYVGQAGGFASRGYARVGYRTAFVGALGDDLAGAMARDALARDGVDLRGVFRDPEGTARSVNLVFGDGRRFFYDGKGHMGLRPDLDACRRMLARAQLAHVNIPNWARLLLPLARELGVPVGSDVQDGAGDALAVGFLSARVLEGKSLEEAVMWGQAAARHACAQPAPKTNLVTASELRRYLTALND